MTTIHTDMVEPHTDGGLDESGIEDDLWAGVSTLVDSYVQPEPGEEFLVTYTPLARDPAAWVVAALRQRGYDPRPLGMLPLVDDGFPARLRATLPPQDDLRGKLVLITIERDTMSHSIEIREVLHGYPPESCRIFRIINASDELFRQAIRLTPATLSAINAGVLNRLMPSRHIHVTSTAGTDLEIDIDSERYRWLSNRGIWRPEAFVILPAGEVNTFPANINGTLVADGAFNTTAYTALDARLAESPVTVEILHGRAVQFQTEDDRVRRVVERCFAPPNADRVGELGFGTNLGVRTFIPMNSHINERHAGLHLGFGQHTQRLEVVPYTCQVHLDLITADSTIEVDDQGPPMRSWELRPVSAPHPESSVYGIYDEDIDGDCCVLAQ